MPVTIISTTAQISTPGANVTSAMKFRNIVPIRTWKKPIQPSALCQYWTGP